MGPGAGTAMLGGTGLGFANVVSGADETAPILDPASAWSPPPAPARRRWRHCSTGAAPGSPPSSASAGVTCRRPSEAAWPRAAFGPCGPTPAPTPCFSSPSRRRRASPERCWPRLGGFTASRGAPGQAGRGRPHRPGRVGPHTRRGAAGLDAGGRGHPPAGRPRPPAPRSRRRAQGGGHRGGGRPAGRAPPGPRALLRRNALLRGAGDPVGHSRAGVLQHAAPQRAGACRPPTAPTSASTSARRSTPRAAPTR